ncbi:MULTISPECIES: TetR/AcrR family transcriptional regulator [Lysobacter]|uniref:TetR/AcrR family transcriptional regulator n=1 Tax=Lysobacter TaxID=68 RepID=UPI00068D3789|nr:MULTISPECIES: TetR/AcrR family transcriptional regulator [Lysobacter]
MPSPSAFALPQPAFAAAAAPTREALLDVAARLFVERGTERVALADIAAGAGLELRVLRDHFASREHVLLALQQRFVEGFRVRLHEAMDRCRPNDWPARLRAWVQSAVEGYLDQVALHDVVFHDLRTHDRHAMQENPVVDQLVELLEGGIAARVWAAPDPRLTAVIFFTAMHSAVDRVIACGEPQDRQRLVQTLIGYFERSVQWWARF